MNASIRNIALASGLTIVSLLSLSTAVQAQTTTVLTVGISANCSFLTAPTGTNESKSSFSAITLTSLQSNLVLTCNGNNFTVNAKSTNGGKLKSGTIPEYIPYTVATSSGIGTGTNTTFFSAAPLTTSDQPIVVRTGYSTICADPVTGCSAKFTWTLGTPKDGSGADITALPIGSYTDTITYTLSAN